MTELAKARGNYVATKKVYVAIEFARVGRIYVATEDFWVATELATIENLAAQNEARHAKANKHDSAALRCVTTKVLCRARQRCSITQDIVGRARQA